MFISGSSAAVYDSLARTDNRPHLQMAMVTVCILAMPNLGNSVVKGVQRITGVMIGRLQAWRDGQMYVYVNQQGGTHCQHGDTSATSEVNRLHPLLPPCMLCRRSILQMCWPSLLCLCSLVCRQHTRTCIDGWPALPQPLQLLSTATYGC